MKNVSITRYSQLTKEQWTRVVVTAKRQVRRRTGKACDVGLGRKFRNGEPYGWQISLRIYLPRKRQKVAKERLIPAYFPIRLRRVDGSYDLLRIRSDVDSLTEIVPTAASVRAGQRQAAGGVLISWRQQSKRFWGVATVAHLFDDIRRKAVTLFTDGGLQLAGRLLRKAPLRHGLDLAVLQLSGSASQIESDLIGLGWLESADLQPIKCLTTWQVELATQQRQLGVTYPPGDAHKFRMEETFPDGLTVGRRRLRHCVRVRQQAENVFRPGTSGSYWRVGPRPACLQVGGRQPLFAEGIGQSLQEVHDWLHANLDRSVMIVGIF